jgi:hypothetical protein
VTLSANTTFTAQWKEIYSVVGSIDNGGTVTNGLQTVVEGNASAEMVFTPAVGYEISSITINDEEQNVADKNSYTYAAQTISGPVEVVVLTVLADYEVTIHHYLKDTTTSLYEDTLDTQKYGTTLDLKSYEQTITGYKVASYSEDTLQVGASDNDATIYYEKDPEQTKTLSYTVRYYLNYTVDSSKDGDMGQAFAADVVEQTVWVGDPDTLEIKNIEIKQIAGFQYTKNDRNLELDENGTHLLGAGKSIEDGDVINLCYSTLKTEVTVNMHVEGAYADQTKVFKGTMDVSYYNVKNEYKEDQSEPDEYDPIDIDTNKSAYTYSLTGGDTLSTVTLKAEEQIQFEGMTTSSDYILDRVVYTVNSTSSEIQAASEDNEISLNRDGNGTTSISLPEGSVTIDVYYVRKEVPLTGIEEGDRNASYALITLAAILLGICPLVFRKNRRREQ